MSIIEIDMVSSESIILVNRIKARIWAQRENRIAKIRTYLSDRYLKELLGLDVCSIHWGMDNDQTSLISSLSKPHW